MITISILNAPSDAILSFQKEQWRYADIEHFGSEIEWNKQKRILAAYHDDQLVGVLELWFQQGVMHIETLIVHHDHYRQGIGRSLVEKAEEIAKENELHKIYLETGHDWTSNHLYAAMGYQQTGTLKNHFLNHDYVIYTKLLG